MTLPRESRVQRGRPDLGSLAAAKLVESHGRDALSILEERAELAAENGHRVAAETWRDMAAVAARMLCVERRPPHLSPAAAIARQARPLR